MGGPGPARGAECAAPRADRVTMIARDQHSPGRPIATRPGAGRGRARRAGTGGAGQPAGCGQRGRLVRGGTGSGGPRGRPRSRDRGRPRSRDRASGRGPGPDPGRGGPPRGHVLRAARPGGTACPRPDVHPACGRREHDRLGGRHRDTPSPDRGSRFRVGPDAAGRRPPLASGGPGRRRDRPAGRDRGPGEPGRGRLRQPVLGAARRLPKHGAAPGRRSHAVPGQPALRAAPPDRRAGEGVAAPCRPGAGGARQRAVRPARPFLPGHRGPCGPGRRGRVHHGRRVAGRELRPPGPGVAARRARRPGGPPGRARGAGVRGRGGHLGHHLLPAGDRPGGDPDAAGGRSSGSGHAGGRHPGTRGRPQRLGPLGAAAPPVRLTAFRLPGKAPGRPCRAG